MTAYKDGMPVTASTRELTDVELLALRRWANERGRKWKMWLREAWMNGNYGGFAQSATLQQIRNTFGPSWLITFRFPEE